MSSVDQILVERLLRGEQPAFNEFFKEYFGRLFRFALTRVRDEEVVRDVVQETLCRALRNLRSYRGEAALFTWLCQICRSQLSEHFERHQCQVKYFAPIEDDPDIQATLDSLVAPDANPADIAHRGEVLRLVWVVLDQLPLRYGNALEWKYVEGVSVAVIATRLGVPHAAAQSILQRARGAFRQLFEEIYGTTNITQLFATNTSGYRGNNS